MPVLFGEIWRTSVQYPKSALIIAFWTWKLLLFLVAISSPGIGYDTSTFLLEPPVTGVPGKLVRWDAIYYTQIARRGYVLEQEWAFGWGFTRVLAFLTTGIKTVQLISNGDAEACAGIIVAHVSHLLSVLVLYKLSQEIFNTSDKDSRLALISAFLHIISPAGIFLSAPYSESLFSLLQFSGYYCYIRGRTNSSNGLDFRVHVWILSSGLLFGLATTVRSNGLLSGILFAWDAIGYGLDLVIYQRGVSELLPKFTAVISAGLLVSLGIGIPQYFAYQEYCAIQGQERPWCNSVVPSIYSWVQSHYWNNGFLRYWTLSNVPLFILALPMLSIMTQSAIWTWMEKRRPSAERVPGKRSLSINGRHESDVARLPDVLSRLALPQLLLAILALTNHHVQIITRLSSGYPVWYWWLACSLVASESRGPLGGESRKPRFIVRWMIMYAVIQGGLFASFLPPA